MYKNFEQKLRKLSILFNVSRKKISVHVPTTLVEITQMCNINLCQEVLKMVRYSKIPVFPCPWFDIGMCIILFI